MRHVIHLIEDQSFGGVTNMLDTMMKTPSLRAIEQKIVPVNLKNPAPKSYKSDTIIVHFTVSWWSLPYLYALKRVNPKTSMILVEHSYTEGFEHHKVPSKARFRMMLKLNYMIFDHIVAVSHGQKNWMQHIGLGKHNSNIMVIHPLKNIQPLYHLPLKDNRPGKTPLKLGAFGRFAEGKGFDTLIQAMTKLDTQQFQLRLGGFGEEEKKLRALAAHTDNVKFIGKVTDLANYLKSIDVLVVPSQHEAFGLVALEARAAGVPLIVSNVDGLPEQATRSELIFQPNSSNSLIKSINAIYTSSLKTLAKEGRNSTIGYMDTQVAAWKNLLT